MNAKHNGYWNGARSFLADCNGTNGIHVRINDAVEWPVGGCGMRPDVAAMQTESVSIFDIIADEHNWSGQDRLFYREIMERFSRSDRKQWLNKQVRECVATGLIPWHSLAPEERTWFLREWQSRKAWRAPH